MTTPLRHPRAFTLAEFVIASAVTALVLLTLITIYVQATHTLRYIWLRLWAQQRARAALETIAASARHAYQCELYSSYAPSPGTQVLTGNYVRFFHTNGSTCGVYRSGTILYFIPSEAQDNRASSADDIPLLSGLLPQPPFIAGYNQIRVQLSVADDRATNTTLMAVNTYITLRNL